MKLGIVFATVLAKSHWRWSSTSRRLRSVMSMPPAMIRTTSPFWSTSGAVCHAITRSCPCAFRKTFSYSDAGKLGDASRKRWIIASRSSGSMKTSQKKRPSMLARSSRPLAISTARLKFLIRPSVSTTESRLGAVLMIVSRNRYCARSSAWRRSFSNASEAVAATASTSSRWSARLRSCRSAATRLPPCSTNVAARAPRAIGSDSVWPSSSTQAWRCADQYARSSDGSPSAVASASRSGTPLPREIARLAIPARASRVRRIPARKAIGISASDASAANSIA